ncbi:MAG: LuxR C-terminal-related transcriptional regulator [Dehalococcoidia bacterium]
MSLLEEIRGNYPQCPILIIADRPSKAEMVALARLAIRGPIPWSHLTEDRLLLAVYSMLKTRLWEDEDALRRVLLKDLDGARRPATPLQDLPELDRQILQDYADGLSYKKIGEILNVSHSTVVRVLSNLEAKLHVSNGRRLVVEAAKLGLVS